MFSREKWVGKNWAGNSEASSEAERHWSELADAYRLACPDVEPSANFMPTLWQKIDARRSYHRTLELFTRRIVTAAGLACLVLTSLLFLPADDPVLVGDRLELLADGASPDAQTDLDLEAFSRQ